MVVRCGDDYQQPVLVEEFIDGEELTVGVIGNDPPVVIGIMRVLPLRHDGPFVYDLEVKRDWRRQVRYEVPAQLRAADDPAVRHAALAAFRALGCRDVARIDFRLRGGVPYFLEANPLPGLSPGTSDLVLLADGVGIDYQALIGQIADAAMARVFSRRCSGNPIPSNIDSATAVNRSLRIALVYNASGALARGSRLRIGGRGFGIGGGVEIGPDAVRTHVIELAAGDSVGKLIEHLESLRADVVVNLCESWAGNSANEPHVAALLELLRLPYTGSPPECLGLVRDKVRTKRLLAGSGIATPNSSKSLQRNRRGNASYAAGSTRDLFLSNRVAKMRASASVSPV